MPRYSDKYRPSLATQPTLKRKDLHQAFFPQEIFEGYFNPKKRKIGDKKAQKKRLNLDDVVDDAEDKVCLCLFPTLLFLLTFSQEKSDDERSDVGSQAAESDYDVDEEYDNDYAENYFDNGEGDDNDDLGGGGGGDEGGGESDFVLGEGFSKTFFAQDTTTTSFCIYFFPGTASLSSWIRNKPCIVSTIRRPMRRSLSVQVRLSPTFHRLPFPSFRG